MASTVQSLAALLQRSSIEDHEEIIKACNAILKKSKNDIGTQYVKVVALLKCDRFEDAIRVIEEGGDALKNQAMLEWAYALYKTGKLDEAVAAAASAGKGRGAKHIEAQASYRAENFTRSKEIYQELYNHEDADEQEKVDLRINMRATDAQLHWSRQAGGSVDIQRPTREDLEAFETTYNAACEYIARGQLDQAYLLLKRAKELCNTSEDLSPEDKDAELLPISVQLLYVAQQLGKTEDIESLVDEIIVDRISEPSTKIIAQNNILVTAHQESNPYLQHKLFHSTPKSTGNDRLFSFQNRSLDGNSHAIDLLVHKYKGVARSTAKTLSQQHSSTASAEINNLSVVNVAAHCRGETGKACLKKALPLLEKRPNDVGLVLTIVQLYAETKNFNSATSVLESLLKRLEESISESDQDTRFNPGLVSVLISLYKTQGRKRGIKAELSKAAAHWQQRPDQARPLLRVAASSLLHSSILFDLEKASEIFSKLHKLDPSDPVAAAGYVASHAALSPSPQIQCEAQKLSSVQDLTSGIDVAALEEAGIPAPAATISSLGVSRKRAAGDEDKQVRKKRVRKSRLPKDYDPNKQPDPERWLPLRDRSTYRPPKGKKGKQKAAERTQGGIVSEESAAPSPVVAPQQKAQSGGGSSKKKKKGKR